MKQRILLVEDESSIRSLVKLNLEIDGYEVVDLDNGKEVMTTIAEQHFDLIILDIMLPDLSGIKICESIRVNNYSMPILILSAKDTSHDRILGLKKGADDYLTKPFHLEELILRVEKLITRNQNANASQVSDDFSFGENKVNFSSFEAVGVDGAFQMTKKEITLLKLLVERSPDVVSRQVILQNVWGYDVYPSTRTIDNFILAFRKYFEENPKEPKYFISIRGVGYKFIAG